MTEAVGVTAATAAPAPPYPSEGGFLTLHALRVKGFAEVATLAPLLGLPVESLAAELVDLEARELARSRAPRGLWQLTPAGREAHATALAADVGRPLVRESLTAPYRRFLELDGSFKALCTDWQLRGGAPNDHADATYDRAVVDRLAAHHRATLPVVAAMGEVLSRLARYAPRLGVACAQVGAGETGQFTGVMCGSYHDIWMELHEDLLVTLGIDRAEEGSS